MTPQERDLITALLDRLKQAAQGGQAKDAEAEALIRRAVQEQPDAPYYLVQTVLIQDMALNTAQTRIADLERQLAAAKAGQQPPQQSAASGSSSFLGGAVPSVGPWGPAPQVARQSYAQPQSQPQPMAPAPAPQQGQPWGGGQPAMAAPPGAMPYATAPGAMGGMFGGGGGGGGFLRSAAATAAGVAGGALLFQGIESMFGGHHGLGGGLGGAGFAGGIPQQPSISETVINNYYGEEPRPDAGQDYQSAGWDQGQGGGADPGYDPQPADYASDDPGFDPGQDFASNDDFGGGNDDDFA